MFSNGSIKVMGVFFAFSSLVIGYLGISLRNEPNRLWVFMLGMAAVFGVIAAACLVEAGRAVTGRITAAIAFLICSVLLFAALNSALQGQKIEVEVGDSIIGVRWWSFGQVIFFAIMTLSSGYYTVHGRFPEKWTFEELFRWPSAPSAKRKSKSTKPRKAKRRLQSLEE